MKLPRKIDPDRIKDSIVEVKFTSTIPYEIYLGQIYQSLDDSYNYTNRPPIGQKHIQLPVDVPRELKLTLGNHLALFFNDKIKFEIQPGSIIFNCVDKYITWEYYLPEIVSVLNQIQKSNCIKSFNRIGIRYISEYPETDIKSITKFNFSFGMPDVSSDNYSFRSEYKKDNFRVILNLSSRIPTANTEISNRKTISSIDIDVISEVFDHSELKPLIDLIEQVHTLEKVTFFNLLTEDFLISLNPKY
jgi:uncharacterized protein (TIGR04255 family)